MVILNCIRLLILLFVGVRATVSDLKHGIIRNRLTAFAAGAGILLSVISYGFVAPGQAAAYLVNCAIVILLSLALYALKVWAGGDTKLLCAVALLYPVDYYWNDFPESPTLFYAIGFMFSIGFLYLIGDSIKHYFVRRTSTLQKLKKQILHALCTYFQTTVMLSLFSLLFQLVIPPSLSVSGLVLSSISICLVFVLGRFPILYSWYSTAVCCLANVVILLFSQQRAFSFNPYTYLIALIMITLRLFVEQYNYQVIPSDSVQPGMILSQMSSAQFSQSRVKGLPPLSDETLRSRLTQEEAASIIRWKDSKYGSSELVIVRKVPFAVFIFLGTVFYLLLKVVIF